MIDYNIESVRYVDDKSLGLEEPIEVGNKIVYTLRDCYLEIENNLNNIRELEEKYHCSVYRSLKYYDIINDKYIVQSITCIENKIFISAYRKNRYSRLYIFDLLSSCYEGMIVLDNKAHVGGISYDKDNQILFVTGSNGEINSYDYRVIKEISNSCEKEYIIDFSDNIHFNEEQRMQIKINNNINIKKLDSNADASTIYYYNGRLYVGTFNPTNNGYLYSYKVEYDKDNKNIRIIDEHTKKYRIGARIQGIGLTNYNGIEYLVCTQSIGVAKSVFLLYEVNEDCLTFLGRKYLDDIGLEGITIDERGYIIGIFENNPRKTIVINIGELINEISSSWMDYDPGNTFVSWVGGLVYKITHK